MNNLSNISSKFSLLFLVLFALTFTACDDDEGGPINEQEVITTVRFVLTELPDNTITTYSVTDADGDGGNPPVAEEIKLKANTSYTFSTIFLDESNPNDVEDLTTEVAEENLEHLVCYSTTGGIPVPVVGDSDTAGNPLGLIGDLTTEDIGTGTLQIVLKHEPDKTIADPCSTGETDAEVTFPVVIE